MAFGLATLGFALLLALPARAASYTADYCEPKPGVKLLYNDRAYLVLAKTDADQQMQYSYQILTGNGKAQRTGQIIFREDDETWEIDPDQEGVGALWPLQPDKTYSFVRVERGGEHAGERITVEFKVVGLEPLSFASRQMPSWKIRRLDRDAKGAVRFFQFMWYVPEFCALAGFTDSQSRYVTLLRVLKPGDPDYDRPLARRKGKLVFSDTGEAVK
jgi:hypothetical protein